MTTNVRNKEYYRAWRKDHREHYRAYSRTVKNDNRAAMSPIEREAENARCVQNSKVRYRRYKAMPRTLVHTIAPSDTAMLSLMQVLDWHSHVYIGRHSKLVDTVTAMIWEYHAVGHVDTATGFGHTLDVNSGSAYNRMLNLRKQMPALIGYLSALGILAARQTPRAVDYAALCLSIHA